MELVVSTVEMHRDFRPAKIWTILAQGAEIPTVKIAVRTVCT